MSSTPSHSQPVINEMRLPQELIDLILDIFASNKRNHASLPQLLHVSRVFHPTVRKHLFSEANLIYDDAQHRANPSAKSTLLTFLELIEDSRGEILPHLRRVRLCLYGAIQNFCLNKDQPISNPQVLSLLEKLTVAPNLETLCLAGTGWNCNPTHFRRLGKHPPYDCAIAKALLALRCKPELRTLEVEWDCPHSALVTGVPGQDSVTKLTLAPLNRCQHGTTAMSVSTTEFSFSSRPTAPLPPSLALDKDAQAPFRNLVSLNFSDAQPLRFPWETLIEYGAFLNVPTKMYIYEHLAIPSTKAQPMLPSLESLSVDCEMDETGYFGLMLLLTHAPKLRQLRFQESFHPRCLQRSPQGQSLALCFPLLQKSTKYIFASSTLDRRAAAPSLPYDACQHFFVVAKTHPSLKDITIVIDEPVKRVPGVEYPALLSRLAEFLAQAIKKDPNGVLTTLRLVIHWPLAQISRTNKIRFASFDPGHEDCPIRPTMHLILFHTAIQRLVGQPLRSFSLDFVCEEGRLSPAQRPMDYRGSETHKQVEKHCAGLGKAFRMPGLEAECRFILVGDD